MADNVRLNKVLRELNISIDAVDTENTTASITSVTTKNGVESIEKVSYYGTEDEVEKLLEERINDVTNK